MGNRRKWRPASSDDRDSRPMYREVDSGFSDAGRAMDAKRRWSELGEGQRRAIKTVAVIEGILKLAALIDIVRRPADQIRGSKWGWATSVIVVNSAGVVPISYFLFGRRP